MSWVANEVAGCRLKDQRLKQRLAVIVERLGAKPTASIPAACRGWGETQATYRFLSNERVTATEILTGHSQATVRRIAAEPVVLIVQDTTFLEYIKDVMGKGMGTLRETSREEHLLHPSVAFTPARVNLGVLTHQFWQRPEEPVGHLRAQRPIEEKESYRWVTGYNVACEVQRCCPETLVVSVADREGDIHEWFLAATERAEDERAAFVIRAKCNRRVAAQPQDTYLWGALGAAPVLGRTTIEVAAHARRSARQAHLTVRARSVTFNRGRRRGGHLPPVRVQALYVTEEDPPSGEEPLEWMLLTNLPVADFKTAKVILRWYRTRWEIELYFRILKQGCQIEKLRLEMPERLERCIAVYMIIAWRLHHLTQAARASPAVPCTKVFARKEWQTIYLLHHHKRPPQHPPPLRTMTRMLAQLGGFLARTGDGEPGVETIWRGYMEMLRAVHTLALAKAVGL
jgi:Transposase DNA-binding/Transposase Tn5 dimerisation domain